MLNWYFTDGALVRAVERDGVVWLAALDLAQILGMPDGAQLARKVASEDRSLVNGLLILRDATALRLVARSYNERAPELLDFLVEQLRNQARVARFPVLASDTLVSTRQLATAMGRERVTLAFDEHLRSVVRDLNALLPDELVMIEEGLGETWYDPNVVWAMFGLLAEPGQALDDLIAGKVEGLSREAIEQRIQDLAEQRAQERMSRGK
jgi:hypothetical protein